jgi:hypothetical protein
MKMAFSQLQNHRWWAALRVMLRGGKVEERCTAWYLRPILRPQYLDSLLTISQKCGIARLFFEKPGAQIVTGTKDARVREWLIGEWATEKEGSDGEGEEASEHNEKVAGRHGYHKERVLLMRGNQAAVS